ncbi:hypothetical protein BCR33DRAFT_723431 [Rhizoclosmatium globosum]|uniref:Uncharacterized protein n=1 Tax=Rhizoclosmatium globosum TaxID=329046 RepID=A0A1Y2BCY0_9FUNG|nr:hypothetical protein BCR33DRAFT_723431 [Rhizoclosmatium globosum]|eukprot:ORY32390.1 hypothetical protein BCR33DRAFT_723431 [Rhizoclosmatium globosum]
MSEPSNKPLGPQTKNYQREPEGCWRFGHHQLDTKSQMFAARESLQEMPVTRFCGE